MRSMVIGIKKRVKSLLPKSIFARFMAIIILPIIVAQFFAIYIFYSKHWSSVSRHMVSSLVGEIEYINSLSLDELKLNSEKLNNSLYLEMTILNDISFEELELNYIINRNLNEIRNRLSYVKDFKIGLAEENDDVIILIKKENNVVKITTTSKRLINQTTYIFIMWMVGVTIFFLGLSVIFIKNQLASIKKLSSAAENFGKGVDNFNFKPTGALEVRKAGNVFIEMKDRINKQVGQRTDMLSGVSHDLKTPLTRVKLQLAMMNKTKEVEELSEDIQEMENMIEGYLNFAKGQVIDNVSVINITELFRKIVASYKNDSSRIKLNIEAGVKLKLRSDAIKRVICNLIDNAMRFANNLEINAYIEKEFLVINFDDDGAGIAKKERDLVFKPFYRVEDSRNPSTGGVGLGLSIVKDIVTSHAGEIKLAKSPQDGLRVTIKLPM